MLRRIEKDKWKHFYVGILMGAFLQAFAWWFWPAQILAASLLVLLVIIGISYGFELFSKITGKGRYDFIDAVASVIGGMVGMGIVVMCLLLFF